MIRPHLAAVACVLSLFVVGEHLSQATDAQSQPGNTPSQPGNAPTGEEGGAPIARADRPLPSSYRERELRLKRSRKFNSSGAPLTAAPGDVVVSSEIQPVRAPVVRSHVIVVGRVSSAEAFLSENQTAVYSEFQITVEDVLRATGDFLRATRDSALEPGDLVTALRWGGRLRLPSGRVVRVEMADMGLPHLGGRYLLFLREDPALEAYRILTVYSLNGNLAQTLDGPRGVFLDTGLSARPRPEPADALLTDVRRLIASSNGAVE
jgi:hypothetical protein